MRLFTGTLLTDLSAAAQLRDHGLDLDPDVAEDRCKQLVPAASRRNSRFLARLLGMTTS